MWGVYGALIASVFVHDSTHQRGPYYVHALNSVREMLRVEPKGSDLGTDFHKPGANVQTEKSRSE
jgi:hypothetical protein